MSDRRVPRRYGPGSVDLQAQGMVILPQFDASGPRRAARSNRSRKLTADTSTRPPVTTHGISHEEARERRLELLARRLPSRVQRMFRWLRQPSARWVRIPAGTLLI